MSNLYKNCKIQDNTTELIYENSNLFITIFENNIVHVAKKPGIDSVAIEESYIPAAAVPAILTTAEAGVGDEAVKAVIKAKDITVNVKDNEKLDIYYNGIEAVSTFKYEQIKRESKKDSTDLVSIMK